MKTTSLLILAAMIIAGCSKDSSNGGTSTEKTISITESSYNGGYQAVWFNPTNGSIKAVGEDPDESYSEKSDYKFWIEPGGPEFTCDYETTYGVIFMGNGDDVFNNTQKSTSLSGFQSDIIHSQWVIGNVFYIKVPKGDCLIQIIDFSIDNDWLTFKWKKL
jgi:hypothetical protein